MMKEPKLQNGIKDLAKPRIELRYGVLKHNITMTC